MSAFNIVCSTASDAASDAASVFCFIGLHQSEGQGLLVLAGECYDTSSMLPIPACRTMPVLGLA